MKIEQVSGFSQFEVVHDRQAMARHKINVDTVNELLEAAVGGKTASTLYDNLVPVEIVVRLDGARAREGQDEASGDVRSAKSITAGEDLPG